MELNDQSNQNNSLPPLDSTPQPNISTQTPQTPKKLSGKIIAVILLTLIAGTVIFIYFKKQASIDNNMLLNATSKAKPVVTLADCQKLQNLTKQGSCYYELAKATKDITLCDKATDKNVCILGVAVAKQDASLCAQAHFTSQNPTADEDQFVKWTGCYQPIAVAKKDQSVCDGLTNQGLKQTCYSAVAVAQGNSTSCNNLTDDSAKDECYSGIAKSNSDDSYCAKIKSAYTEDACYQIVGIAKLDTTICDKMVDFDSKDEFKGACYLKIAEATKDATICDRLTFFANYQSACYSNVGTANSDSSVCAKITNTHDANGCYASLANKTGDVSLCSKIAPGEDKDSCLAYVSIKKKDLTLCQQIDILKYQLMCYQSITGEAPAVPPQSNSGDCGNISNPTEQYNCYVTQAESKKDPTICSKMSSQDFKDNCYTQVAKDTKNPQLCAKVVTQKNKDNCNYALAAVVKDGKWCDYIVDQGLKNGCLLPFQVSQPSKPQLNVTMDLAMATLTGKVGETVKVTGTIENYSTDTVYLNSMGGTLTSPDLDLDTTDFFSIVPRTFKPGETYQGPLFAIVVGNNVKPGNYFVNFYFTGGKTEMDSGDLTSQNLSITIQ